MLLRHIVTSAISLALLGGSVAPAAAKSLDPGVVSALATIKRDAEGIAAGRYVGKAIQSPAREIALAWGSIEPALARDGDILVETKMANASIAKLEADWQRNKNVRDEAKDVSANVADLVSAAKS